VLKQALDKFADDVKAGRITKDEYHSGKKEVQEKSLVN
jgi:hypothetical protein